MLRNDQHFFFGRSKPLCLHEVVSFLICKPCKSLSYFTRINPWIRELIDSKGALVVPWYGSDGAAACLEQNKQKKQLISNKQNNRIAKL